MLPDVFLRPLAACALIMSASPTLWAQQPVPAKPDDAAIDRGRTTYGFYCMNCHGGDGRGGRDGGSDLTESEMLKADDDGLEFAAFLPVGRPDQRMPPTPLETDETADLWAFLRVLVGADAPGKAAAAPVAGDVEQGARHFTTSKCTQCHSVTGDLQGIGSRLDAATIHARLLTLPPPDKRTAAREPRDADTRQGHAMSVKKLSEQAVRDLAAYLATLR